MNILEEARNISSMMIMKGTACTEPVLNADGSASFLAVDLVRKGKKIVEQRRTITVKPA